MHTIPPDHRACLFISHLNSPGSMQPGCHFRPTELFKHTSLHCQTLYPLTPGWRERTCEQSALPRSTTSEHIQRSRGPNRRSLACTSRTLPLSHDASPLFATSLSFEKMMYTFWYQKEAPWQANDSCFMGYSILVHSSDWPGQEEGLLKVGLSFRCCFHSLRKWRAYIDSTWIFSELKFKQCWEFFWFFGKSG